MVHERHQAPVWHLSLKRAQIFLWRVRSSWGRAWSFPRSVYHTSALWLQLKTLPQLSKGCFTVL